MSPLRITSLLACVSTCAIADPAAVDLATPTTSQQSIQEPVVTPGQDGPILDYTTRATYTYTENHGRASGASDFRDGSAAKAEVIVGTGKQIARDVTLRLQLEGAALASWDYEKLGEATVGPRAIVRKKFGLGPTAPTVSFETAALGKVARVDEQNGVTFQGALTVSKRFNSVFSSRIRADWQEQVADHNVFDTQHIGVEASLSLDLSDRLRFSIGGGYVNGLVTAGASKARLDNAKLGALGQRIADYYNSVPSATTGAYEANWQAYRVEGDSDYVFFDFSPAITDSLSLAFRYERVHFTNIVSVTYRQDVFSAGVVYSF